MPQVLTYTKCPQLQGNYIKHPYTSMVWAIALGKVRAPWNKETFGRSC